MIDSAIERKQLNVGNQLDQLKDIAVSYGNSQSASADGSEHRLDACYILLIEEFHLLDRHLNTFLLGVMDSLDS